METIHPIRAINPYEHNLNWFQASVSHSQSSPQPLSDFMTRYPFARHAQEQYAVTAAEGLAAILSSARKLQETASTLLSSDHSVFSERRAVIDGNAVLADVGPGAEEADYTVQVNAVAQAQVNSGASFVKDATTSIRSGWNEFDVQSDNRTTTRVSFWVHAEDTHEQALQKMSRAINQTDAGITAQTVTDSTGKIKLEIRGEKTGASHEFSLSDVSGNAIAATGSRLVSVSARDAAYSIDDGAVKTAEANHIWLDEGRLKLTLQNTTPDQPVHITVRPDADAVVSRVQQLVTDYNNLKQSADRAAGIVSPTVTNRMRNAITGAGLDRLGIERQPNGGLKLDQESLRSRIETDFPAVETEIGGPHGLAFRLEKLGGRLQSAPAESLLSRSSRDYMRYANYQSSLELYSQLPANGRLINRKF